jgi:hypothetical protein
LWCNTRLSARKTGPFRARIWCSATGLRTTLETKNPRVFHRLASFDRLNLPANWYSRKCHSPLLSWGQLWPYQRPITAASCAPLALSTRPFIELERIDGSARLSRCSARVALYGMKLDLMRNTPGRPKCFSPPRGADAQRQVWGRSQGNAGPPQVSLSTSRLASRSDSEPSKLPQRRVGPLDRDEQAWRVCSHPLSPRPSSAARPLAAGWRGRQWLS